jgi:hypothetical protein
MMHGLRQCALLFTVHVLLWYSVSRLGFKLYPRLLDVDVCDWESTKRTQERSHSNINQLSLATDF